MNIQLKSRSPTSHSEAVVDVYTGGRYRGTLVLPTTHLRAIQRALGLRRDPTDRAIRGSGAGAKQPTKSDGGN